jgi:RNA polymerase sigma factor (TIGR02999 family)
MTDVTRILSQAEEGDANAINELLPVVYDELRRLAKQKMTHEVAGHTLDATGLVHEAYLRMVGADRGQAWENRRHFFAAAAESMRRILIESARRRARLKRGGDQQRIELDDVPVTMTLPVDQLLAVDEALESLSRQDQVAAEIVKLRFFAGFSVEDAAESLGMSRATAYRHWTWARAWLQCELGTSGSVSNAPEKSDEILPEK